MNDNIYNVNILTELSRLKNNPERYKKEVVKGVSSIFVQMLMEELSKDISENDTIFSSRETKFWENQLIMQLSLEVSKSETFPLNNYILEALKKYSS